MKTPEEIKKGLELCKRNSCSKSCPYHGEGACYVKLHRDALILIMNHETAHRTEYCEAADYDCEMLGLANMRIQKLERERDSAVECMRGACYLCIHTYPGISYLSGSDCIGCRYNMVDHDGDDKWQWRGVQEGCE